MCDAKMVKCIVIHTIALYRTRKRGKCLYTVESSGEIRCIVWSLYSVLVLHTGCFRFFYKNHINTYITMAAKKATRKKAQPRKLLAKRFLRSARSTSMRTRKRLPRGSVFFRFCGGGGYETPSMKVCSSASTKSSVLSHLNN